MFVGIDYYVYEFESAVKFPPNLRVIDHFIIIIIILVHNSSLGASFAEVMKI